MRLKRYFGKTDHCFHVKMNEHGRKSRSTYA